MRRTNSKEVKAAVRNYLTEVAQSEELSTIKDIKAKFINEYGCARDLPYKSIGLSYGFAKKSIKQIIFMNAVKLFPQIAKPLILNCLDGFKQFIY